MELLQLKYFKTVAEIGKISDSAHTLFISPPALNHLRKIFQDNEIPMPTGNAYSHLVTQQMVAKGLGVAFATQHTGHTITLPLRYIPIRNNYEPWKTNLYWRKNHEFSEDEMIFKEFAIKHYRTSMT